jgi:hypothetical protein
MKNGTKMEPLDSEDLVARERYEARINATAVKKNILKLSRLFTKKQLQDKLCKEFTFPKTNDISQFQECFVDCRNLWTDKLKTPLEEMNNLRSIMEGPQGLITKTVLLKA